MFDRVVNKNKGTTPWWKVIPFMVLIAVVIGIRTCRVMDREQADEQRREQQWKQEHGTTG